MKHRDAAFPSPVQLLLVHRFRRAFPRDRSSASSNGSVLVPDWITTARERDGTTSSEDAGRPKHCGNGDVATNRLIRERQANRGPADGIASTVRSFIERYSNARCAASSQTDQSTSHSSLSACSATTRSSRAPFPSGITATRERADGRLHLSYQPWKERSYLDSAFILDDESLLTDPVLGQRMVGDDRAPFETRTDSSVEGGLALRSSSKAIPNRKGRRWVGMLPLTCR